MTTAETLSDSTPYTGASITVHVGRDTIDPQGLGSDEECAACEEHILDAVREAFPCADVRAVSSGGRMSGTTRNGADLTDEVKAVVTQAFDSFEWPAEGVLVSLDNGNSTTLVDTIGGAQSFVDAYGERNIVDHLAAQGLPTEDYSDALALLRGFAGSLRDGEVPTLS